ncbi:MAG: alpha/beta fold hydrolase [Ferruginibacter sp.]
MQTEKNILIMGANNRLMTIDIFFDTMDHPLPVVIYAHGFNGFKDWGNFDLVAKRFAREGFAMIKFNFSHNGTTPEHPEDFADLEAFGKNNYSIQLNDLSRIIDWVCDPQNSYSKILDTSNISLVGHSMGGGIAILQAAADKRVSRLITWASVSECKTPWGNWTEERIELWKKEGVQYYTNTRTNQQMPMYYQLYEDYVQNADKLDIKKAIQQLNIPILICHGLNDISVPVDKAYELKAWQPLAELFTLETDHVFGRRHPWLNVNMPREMEAVVNETILFIR